MALIKVDTKNTNLEDQHSIIKLNLNNRNFEWSDDYIVSVVGDNNSQTITFEFDKEYDGVDLFGTQCVLTYWTSWTDDKGNHSKGQILLDTIEVEDKLQCKWVLDQYQTAKSGYCLFTISFYLNLVEDYYYSDRTNTKPVYDSFTGKWYIYNELTDEYIQYAYYALTSTAGQFNIVDTGIGEGTTIELPDKQSGIGRLSVYGGTILNDYEDNQSLNEYSLSSGKNNIAGTLGYHIINLTIFVPENSSIGFFEYAQVEVEDAHLTLKAAEKYAIGDKINFHMNYDFAESFEISEFFTNEETGNSIITVKPVLKQENIIERPFIGFSENGDEFTLNGVTFKNEKNGSIRLNGVAEADTALIFSKNITLPMGRYLFSVKFDKPYSGTTISYIMNVFDGDSKNVYINLGNPTETRLQASKEFIVNTNNKNNVTIQILIKKDAAFEDVIYTPILSYGDFNSEGFSLEEDDETRYSNWLWCTDKPNVGEPFQQAQGTQAGGINSLAGIYGAFAHGREVYSLGAYSGVFGRNNRVGYASFVAGRKITSLGEYNACFGYGHINLSRNTFMTGSAHKSYNYSVFDGFVAGRVNELNHSVTGLIGYGLKSTDQGQLVVGRYNSVNEQPHAQWLFCVGNGSDDDNRSNAFMVYSTVSILGKKEIPDSIPEEVRNRAVTSKWYVDTAIATAINARLIVENGGIILHGRDYGDNGGKQVSADSLAIGSSTKALGQQSFAAGRRTEANAYRSATFGICTIANGYGQFVIGEFNIADPINTPANNSGTKGKNIFIIGNGTEAQRSNAFSVTHNGYAEIQNGLIIGNRDIIINKQEFYWTDGANEFVLGVDEQGKSRTIISCGDVNVDGYKITNMAEPIENTDAATKGYVDNYTKTVKVFYDSDKNIGNLEALDSDIIDYNLFEISLDLDGLRTSDIRLVLPRAFDGADVYLTEPHVFGLEWRTNSYLIKIECVINDDFTVQVEPKSYYRTLSGSWETYMTTKIISIKGLL